MIYERLLRPLLFRLDPESAHHFSLLCLRLAGEYLPGANVPLSPVEAFGLTFPRRFGLAAGFDKNGMALPAWEALGFGFAEIGTVTARAQPGNPRPRIFRYPRQQALINRLGFNNDGADVIAERLQQLRARGHWPRIPIGINIGKSRNTALENAVEDYLYSFRQLHRHADYIALNVSSPNTPGLRELQERAALGSLLAALRRERREVPLLVKIAPDLDEDRLREIVEVCEEQQVSGIIATNTTLDHSAIAPAQDEQGGLSGQPLRPRANQILKHLTKMTALPVVACGGIFNPEDAQERMGAGAKLLQVYTGFVYRGPRLLRELGRAWTEVGGPGVSLSATRGKAT